MSSTVKMIVVDMDGTLLTPEKEISERTMRALREAFARGIHVVPASGRTASTLPEELLALPEIRYTISCNGACLWDRALGRPIGGNLIPLETAMRILDEAAGWDCVPEVAVNGVLYLDAKDSARELEMVAPHLRRHMGHLREETPDLRRMLAESGRDVEKILIFLRGIEERKRLGSILEERYPITVTTSLPTDLEINAPGTGKGSAVTALAEILGIRKEEILAIGDSENDASMLLAAGISVAMGNAEEALKRIASAVTAPNTEDGAARAIEKYALND